MKVVGIDLSLTGTGISDGSQTWVIGTKGVKGASLAERETRLRSMAVGISEMVRNLQPDLVVVEGPAFASNSGSVWDRAGLWWMVVVNTNRLVAEVPPTTLKKYATGKGNAGKPQMLEATIRRLPQIETGADDNRVDALWLATMGLDHLGEIVVEMPALNRQALDAVRWPL